MEDKQVLEYIELDFDDLVNTKVNTSAFKKGVEYGSILNGIITALFNSGLGAENITDIICSLINKNMIIEMKK